MASLIWCWIKPISFDREDETDETLEERNAASEGEKVSLPAEEDIASSDWFVAVHHSSFVATSLLTTESPYLRFSCLFTKSRFYAIMTPIIVVDTVLVFALMTELEEEHNVRLNLRKTIHLGGIAFSFRSYLANGSPC